jgi:hypothetical protein
VHGLFRGLAPPLATVGLSNALLFAAYGRATRRLQPSEAPLPPPLPLGRVWAAGAVAGVACAVVTAPMELVKCRLQVDAAYARTHPAHRPLAGPLACVRAIVHARGVLGLAQGGLVTVARDAPGYGVYFMAYEAGCRALRPAAGLATAADPGPTAVLVAGGLAGCASWTSIYPLDVVKARLQTQPDDAPSRYRGTPPLRGYTARPPSYAYTVCVSASVYVYLSVCLAVGVGARGEGRHSRLCTAHGEHRGLAFAVQGACDASR